MCSFLITNLTLKDIKYINYKLSLRGPDSTNIKFINGITFIHNLLSITGNKITQPFINHDNTLVVLFNGEIYNYKFYEKLFNKTYQTDGECLIDLYNNYGETFTQKIDGEFSIVLFDFIKNKIIVSSDIFATKPMYMAFNNDKFAISTYKYALEELGLKDIYKLWVSNQIVVSEKTYLDNTLYTIKLVYENDPIKLRRLEIISNDEKIQMGFFNHNKENIFDKNFFSMVDPYLQ